MGKTSKNTGTGPGEADAPARDGDGEKATAPKTEGPSAEEQARLDRDAGDVADDIADFA
ncbi:hypothetical protein [Methylobacterium sp. J-076]|uniref:hypothetical protein n=1 Tax=Methylobacterium sp. J-076 TaxID=2836655 RepID=UPI001FB8E2A6|nr:hypothetical protein [Methylobacterium sp. J-076]MCJ2014564.1 hypothetical protein [Methylobacterium sp. J-076]